MIEAASIEFIINLAQYDYGNRYFDFHNEYSCEKLSYCNGILLLCFENLISGDKVSLKFIDVNITAVEYFSGKGIEGLTLDLLYRGRVELNGNLIEISEDGKGYFYLEFYEGQSMEFWAKGLCLETMEG